MKKILLSLFVISAFIFYSIYQKSQNLETIIIVSPKQRINTAQTKQITKTYKDGEYISKVENAYYGDLQIKTIITNGKISDVQFLKYPDERKTSIDISKQSMPLLKQEAIEVQDANVDIISGATQTSQAFREALQSTLDQAKI